MKKNENIFVKLQIEKNTNSGKLALNVHFDSDTPNFYADRNSINWYPTSEELNFVNEAFELLSDHKFKSKNSEEKKITTQYEKQENTIKSDLEKSDSPKSDKPKDENKKIDTLSESEKREVDEWFV